MPIIVLLLILISSIFTSPSVMAEKEMCFTHTQKWHTCPVQPSDVLADE